MVPCLGGLLFLVFLSSWLCGMAGIHQVDGYGLRSIIVSFSKEGPSIYYILLLFVILLCSLLYVYVDICTLQLCIMNYAVCHQTMYLSLYLKN